MGCGRRKGGPEIRLRSQTKPTPSLAGHELSILSYIAGLSAGTSSEADKAASLQLMGQAEDIFGKLGRLQDTIFNGNVHGIVDANDFCDDHTNHNRNFHSDHYCRVPTLQLHTVWKSSYSVGHGLYRPSRTFEPSSQRLSWPR